jgi:putative Mn2+ efflux pump MntP
MNIGKMVIGAILLLVGIYVFIAMTSFAARFVGGGILVILGLVFVVTGLKKTETEIPKKE